MQFPADRCQTFMGTFGWLLVAGGVAAILWLALYRSHRLPRRLIAVQPQLRP